MAIHLAPILRLAAVLTVFPSLAWAATANQTGPTAAPFYSRPDLDSIVLNVTLRNDSLVSPGFIFLAPYQVAQAGPYIFDNDGNLVWSGFGGGGAEVSHDFRVCEYNGSDHLCLFQGNQELGYGRGHDLIMDNSFSVVKTVQSGEGLPPADLHEFNTQGGGKTALITIFHPKPFDLTAFNIDGGVGWILEGAFQEVDIETNEVLFSWRSLDHVDPSAGFVLPNTTDVSGDGVTKDTPWDYFHINAIDKTPEGDYLISSRHAETIYKISGSNGSIIWQLGGKSSDFQQLDGFNFSYQHDVRFISANSTTTIISFFDNAFNGFNGSALFSEGKLVAVNNATMTASLLQAYPAPDPSGGLVAASQGNLQFLPNGNAFLGWGSNAFVSESTADGTPCFYAWFATTGVLQYRSYKFNFTSAPTTTPALYTYAHNDTAQTTFYVSWNGATEVARWNFYSGSSATSLNLVGTVPKNGFETVATQPTFFNFTIAEAVASNGTALRNSTLTQTFVPSAALAVACTDIQCPMVGGFEIQPQVALLSTGTGGTVLAVPSDPSTATTSSTPTSTPNAGERRFPTSRNSLLAFTGAWMAWVML